MKTYTNHPLTIKSKLLSGILAPLIFCWIMGGAPAIAAEPAPQIKPCTACHSVERICLNVDRGSAFWTDTVKRMAANGAHVGPEQAPALVALLANPDHAMVREILNCPVQGSTEAQTVNVPMVLILAHPALMTLTLLLALWVAWQGLNRARFTLLKQKVAFNWKGHTRYGLIVMGLWLAGAVGGSIVTDMLQGIPDTYGLHGGTASLMLVLIVFGGLSGLYMDRKKAKRTILPILHGGANLLLLLMALSQFVTGVGILLRMATP
ncbi:DUF4079 family protein [uncultured Pseudodesulfovibrio sp.]|uniref:DUF4079 family protein n=1 Tax=uncultured Pseudodesulfovibrio sp. TaxID=2035858 RepID=UPI0029C6B238|nr:DUF4079 family protein [uncultured Pseudodesulfovibrio sp.]